MDSTRPTLDCRDHGILAFSQDNITHLSSVMRAGEETTFKWEERGAHCSELAAPATSVAQRTAPGEHRAGHLEPPWSGRQKVGQARGAWPQWKGTDGTCGRGTAGCSFVTVNVNMGQYQEHLSEWLQLGHWLKGWCQQGQIIRHHHKDPVFP